MTTLESHILASVTRYEQESGRELPASSFYKSIALDILRREHCNIRWTIHTTPDGYTATKEGDR